MVTMFDYKLDPLEASITVLAGAFPIHNAANGFPVRETRVATAPDSVSGTVVFLRTPEGFPPAALTLIVTDPSNDAVRLREPVFAVSVKRSSEQLSTHPTPRCSVCLMRLLQYDSVTMLGVTAS